MKRPATNSPFTLRVQAELTNLAVIRQFVRESALTLEAEPSAADDMIQAVDEAATNIIHHGYRGKPGEIEVAVLRRGDALLVQLRDGAPLFDPTTVPPPDLTSPLERRPLGGLGVHLMRQFTDQMSYRVTAEGRNELTLVKRLH